VVYERRELHRFNGFHRAHHDGRGRHQFRNGPQHSEGITAGPDGALWFTNSGIPSLHAAGSIGRITTGGVVTGYTGPGISNPDGITAGPDGALWFTNETNNSIGRITTGGVVTNYTGTGISIPNGITAGPDGALWFTNYGNNSIGRITTGGVVTNYTGTGINPGGITAGPDGALWFTNAGNSIGRNTTVTIGPDGALWFTPSGASRREGSSPTTPERASALRGDHRRPGRRLVVHELREQLHRAHHHRVQPTAIYERSHPFEWGDAVGIDHP
jgi:streptogramin lyase